MADGPRVVFRDKWEQGRGERSSSSTVLIQENEPLP